MNKYFGLGWPELAWVGLGGLGGLGIKNIYNINIHIDKCFGLCWPGWPGYKKTYIYIYLIIY